MADKKLIKGWHIKGGKAPHKDRSITVEPLRKFKDIKAIKECLSKKPRDFALFVTGINTGLRGKDLLKLKFKHILTPDGRIKPRISIRESKTKKIKREFALSTKTKQALGDWCATIENIDMDAYVFPGRNGERMSIQRLHQLVNQWTKQAGVEGHFGSHTLRKTFSYFLLKKGSDIHLLMKILNHSSPAVTLRYAGVEQEDIDRAILKLNL